ncbi:DUF4198 domain-containing protein [Candidatus Uabimicrobium amorphum]|uniref:DUF4198 domain-containing protein n=1 Tax=Uabimicrobium amorphum TaxID=2596890 RepID=A0A5S9IRX9_UABAM|nr:DUF4198 domain-containing protein [Candidatus Uabimicrobium amorphum]BBM87023.1 hypothetical protein UABAM_05425 [Candidatus Uabimicrobium amorphum]
MSKLPIIFLLCCSALHAHTFWLQPSSFTPVKNEVVKMKIQIGHVKEPIEYTRNPYHIRRFLLHHNKKSVPVVGFAGRSPAGFFRVREQGSHTISYESFTSLSSMTKEKFAKYLAEEAFVSVEIPQKDMIHEHYLRCAKAIVQVGKEEQYTPCKVGMPIELICETNPQHGKDSLNVQLLYKNKPLPNNNLRIVSLDDYAEKVVKTTKEGRAVLQLTPGKWLISSIVIEKHTATPNVDFDSFWASLTFTIPK